MEGTLFSLRSCLLDVRLVHVVGPVRSPRCLFAPASYASPCLNEESVHQVPVALAHILWQTVPK